MYVYLKKTVTKEKGENMKTVAALNSVNTNPTHRGKESTTLSEKYRKPRWWQRENKPDPADYRIRDAYADWVRQVDWKLA